MKRSLLKLLLVALTALPFALSADEVKVRWDSYAPERLPTDTLVVDWNHEFLIAIRVIASPPTVNSRHLAVLHTAMYDAWAAYDEKAVGTRLGSTLRRPKSEHTLANKKKAISYAAYVAAIDQFPTQAQQFRLFMEHHGYDPDKYSLDPKTPEGVGTLAAHAVLAFRHNDGANQLGDLNPKGYYTDYTGFKPANTPDEVKDINRWVPLRAGNMLGGLVERHELLQKLRAKPRQPTTSELGGFSVQRYVTPHWGNVRPFALESGDALRPPAPIAFTEADLKPAPNEDNKTYSDITLGEEDYPKTFREQTRQILKYSANLTDREKCIADYWADGPLAESPPGHWNVLAHYVSRRDKNSLDRDVKLFFVLNNAMMDAGIASWDAKRHYDYVRPITAVRKLFAGQTITAWAGPNKGTKEIDGAEWAAFQEPFFITPPFSEYVSGHSTFTHAAAIALKHFTGSDKFGAYALVRPGASPIDIGTVPAAPMVLRWPTFTAAAREASISRRYGGIHFAHGDLEGRRMGRKIGDLNWEMAKEYFEGRAKMEARPHKLIYPNVMTQLATASTAK